MEDGGGKLVRSSSFTRLHLPGLQAEGTRRIPFPAKQGIHKAKQGIHKKSPWISFTPGSMGGRTFKGRIRFIKTA